MIEEQLPLMREVNVNWERKRAKMRLGVRLLGGEPLWKAAGMQPAMEAYFIQEADAQLIKYSAADARNPPLLCNDRLLTTCPPTTSFFDTTRTGGGGQV